MIEVRNRFFFLFVLLLAGAGKDVYAQDYKSVAEQSKEAGAGSGGKGNDQGEDSDAGYKKKKRRNGKEKTRQATDNSRQSSAIVNHSPALIKTPASKKQQIYYPDSKVRKKYKVSVIVPLFLDELVRGESVTFKDKVPDKAAPGLAFYQGVKLAADSLKEAGARMEINIFDAGSYDQSPDMLITNRKLDSTDLIIGAVEQHDIPVLASYARKKKINFVSTLTNYDGWVKDNQYFTMLLPSVKSHCEFIIDDLSTKYAGQNVTLLYRTSSLADDNAALYILNDLYSDVTFRKLLCNTLPGKDVLRNVFDSSKPNILVMSILDPVFADSILQALSAYFPDTHFEIYGMPGWNENANLRKAGKYQNLTVNVTYPFNFEKADSSLINGLRTRFSREFGGMPSEMVWRGYEAMLWYGALLEKYGTIFNENYKDISAAPFTKFKIKPRWDRNGSLLYLENKHIYMSVYQGGVYKTN